MNSWDGEFISVQVRVVLNLPTRLSSVQLSKPANHAEWYPAKKINTEEIITHSDVTYAVAKREAWKNSSLLAEPDLCDTFAPLFD